jgi:hypothetical protein
MNWGHHREMWKFVWIELRNKNYLWWKINKNERTKKKKIVRKLKKENSMC